MDRIRMARELVGIAKDLVAGGWGRFSGDLVDVLQAQNYIHKRKSVQQIFREIKLDKGIVEMMKAERMTDGDLKRFLNDPAIAFFRTM